MLLGALCSLSLASLADDVERPFSVKIGLGKAEFDHSLDTAALTAKGYTVNSYQKDDVEDRSNNYGFAYAISPRLSLDLNWQGFGKVNSSLDIELPADKTAEQAAKDIVDASPQQVGGYMVTVGGNYIQPLYSRLDLRIGGGFLFGSDDHEVTINDEVFDINNNVVAPYAKLGFGVKLTRGLTLTAQAERYFVDNAVERYELGLNYSFSPAQP